jgi:hypothetical protein
MKKTLRLENVEEFIVRDEKVLFTIVSFAMALIIFLNQVIIHSIIFGITSSLIFILLNAVFLGRVFFENETPLLRLVLGGLFLLLFLGIVGWIVMFLYNIDITGSTLTLCVTAALCSVMNRIKTKRLKQEPK